MKKRLAFFLHMEPQPPTVTHQEKKFGGLTQKGTPIFYEPPELKDARALYTSKLSKFAPPKPWNCPISLSTQWAFRRPEDQKKSVWKTTKPDTDNLMKLLKDVMTEVGFWKDDALVCREITEKIWHAPDEKHGILFLIEELK